MVTDEVKLGKNAIIHLGYVRWTTSHISTICGMKRPYNFFYCNMLVFNIYKYFKIFNLKLLIMF